jgi:hypothetical protein
LTLTDNLDTKPALTQDDAIATRGIPPPLSEFPLVKAGHSSLYIIKFDNNLIDLGKAQI